MPSTQITVIWPGSETPYHEVHCAACSGPIAQPRTGRRRKTCSDACRKALQRRRFSDERRDRKQWRREATLAKAQLKRWERKYGPIDDTPQSTGGKYGLRTFIDHDLRRGNLVYQCYVCGKPVNLYKHPRSIGRRYCSSRCMHAEAARQSRFRKVLYVYWGPRRLYAHDFMLWKWGHMVTVCGHCHRVFVPHIRTRNPAKYCSKSCRQAAYYKRKRGRLMLDWRTCSSCGKRFAARYTTQRYCTSRCANTYTERLRRASKLKTKLRFDCIICGSPLPPIPTNGGPRRKYCSPKCQNVTRTRNVKHRREVANPRRCGWCDTPLDWRTYGLIKYCSDSCRRLKNLDDAARYRRTEKERRSTVIPQIVSQNPKSPTLLSHKLTPSTVEISPFL